MTFSVTLLIIIVTCMVSIPCFTNRNLFDQLKHYPVAEHGNKEYYRLISSGFLHGSWVHLGINMYVLYEFGRTVERIFTSQYGEALGRSIFLIAYLAMIVIGDLPTFIKHKNNASYASIGASGAVSGILFMFILYAPWSMLLLYFAIPVPAIIMGVLYLVYSSWASKNQRDMIDHDAHYYGALAGVLLMLVLIPSSFGHFIDSFINGLPF